MKISTKGLYAVRLMLYLAEHDGAGPVSLKEVSDSLGISKKYLEQIVSNVVTAKLVRSIRGAAGGYQMAKPASVITVLDVLRVTEGSLAPASCLEDDTFECNMPVPCMELGVWRGLYKVINEYLGGITLQSIIDEHSAVAADSYSI